VTVKFGGLAAVSDVDISLPAGQAVGLVGPNGAGKSTLFGALTGFTAADSCSILLYGRDITRASPQRRARLGLGRTFQHPELFGSLTVREHLILADRLHFDRQRLWRDLVSVQGWQRPGGAEQTRVAEILELVDLTPVADARVDRLPTGTSRLVEVARAIAGGPRVLLLDEPSAGLDAAETANLAVTLRRIVDEKHVTILLVEHDVGLVLGLSDLVYVLNFGRLLARGTPAEIRQSAEVQAAYLGDLTEAGPSR